jgi:hypothetical protein
VSDFALHTAQALQDFMQKLQSARLEFRRVGEIGSKPLVGADIEGNLQLSNFMQEKTKKASPEGDDATTISR